MSVARMCTTIRTSGEVLSVTTPICCTSGGRRGRARATRFCTWICARSGSVPCLNEMLIDIRPSLDAWELI
ncbi:hypothetical protein D3C86_1709430 [compost metagenome]